MGRGAHGDRLGAQLLMGEGPGVPHDLGHDPLEQVLGGARVYDLVN